MQPLQPRPEPTPPAVAFVIPVKNERDNIVVLVHEIAALALPSLEIVVVDDASRDDTIEVLQANRLACLRIISHARSVGQSAAVRTGVLAARAPVIVTLDGDGQNDPADVPAMLALLDSPNIGMVAGQRRARHDDAIKRLTSRWANAVRGALLRDGIRDTGCGLKVFTREAFLALPFFDHMHRYLPALMIREGYGVRTCDVGHRPRGGGRSNYGTIDRLAAGLVDLPGLLWLMRRRRLPGAVREW